MAWISEQKAQGAVVQLTSGTVRVGRAADSDVVLDGDLKVSRHHAEFLHRQGTWWVRDCGSRNGTLVNGAAVTDVPLQEGDRIRIGAREFVYSEADDPLATLAEAEAPAAEPAIQLSTREREILAWVASGATDVQIARALTLGLSTVHSHLDRIRDKTGRRRRPDLTRLAAELGLDVPKTTSSS